MFPKYFYPALLDVFSKKELYALRRNFWSRSIGVGTEYRHKVVQERLNGLITQYGMKY